MTKKIFTSESVTEGHPDKMCDQISDAILDSILERDKNARVACEVMATTGIVFVAGEVTTSCYVDIDTIVRETVRCIGYKDSLMGFDYDSCAVVVSLKGQSPDIAMGVDRKSDLSDGEAFGAGDQGMVFGFACRETDDFMPMPIYLAHKLTKRLAEVRKTGEIPYLRPDGKAQVSVEYEDGRPVGITCVVVSAQHSSSVEHGEIERDILEKVINPTIPPDLLTEDTKYYINPTGRFVVGGPQSDCGLTGRKIIVDTYGGYASHGGGSFSGKDPTKVDRSAAYMARYAAKNVVAAGLAEKCELQIAYAIGVSRPVSVFVNTYGTGILEDDRISEIVGRHFDFRPAAIIKHFDLQRPIYSQCAAYGHFGRKDLDLPWERLDKVEALKGEISG